MFHMSFFYGRHDQKFSLSGATISLEATELSIMEGNDEDTTTGDLCLRLDNSEGGLERDVVLILTSSEGTAGEGEVR